MINNNTEIHAIEGNGEYKLEQNVIYKMLQSTQNAADIYQNGELTI